MLPPEVTLEAQVGAWLRIAAARYRPATLETYRTALEAHVLPRLGRTPLGLVTRWSLRSLLIQLLHDGLAPRRVQSVLTALSAVLSDAVAEGLLERNAARSAGK